MAILHNPVFFKLALCEGFGDLMRHPAGVVEDLMLIGTLVFPLEKAGDFKSSIRNVEVLNYCKPEM